MTKLFICNTYMQLIMAIHIKLTMFQTDIVDVWLSDSSKGAKEVSERLSCLSLFRVVRFVTWRSEVMRQSKSEKIQSLLSYNFMPVKKLDIDIYDEIIFYNPDIQILAIEDYYGKIGHKVVWSRYDEGILSYNTDLVSGKTVVISRVVRKYIHRKDPFCKVSRYYCMFPNLKETHLEWELITVPRIDEDINRLRQILNHVFNYVPENLPPYIFFASSSDIDGKPFGETELVLKLAEYVGKDNLVVKVHPRDIRTVYQDANIKVMQNSLVPWEVMQLNLDVRRFHLLTVHSGSFISITAMMNDNQIKGDFLYRCIRCPKVFFAKRSKEIHGQLEKLHRNNLNMGLSDNINSLQEISR